MLFKQAIPKILTHKNTYSTFRSLSLGILTNFNESHQGFLYSIHIILLIQKNKYM